MGRGSGGLAALPVGDQVRDVLEARVLHDLAASGVQVEAHRGRVRRVAGRVRGPGHEGVPAVGHRRGVEDQQVRLGRGAHGRVVHEELDGLDVAVVHDVRGQVHLVRGVAEAGRHGGRRLGVTALEGAQREVVHPEVGGQRGVLVALQVDAEGLTRVGAEVEAALHVPEVRVQVGVGGERLEQLTRGGAHLHVEPVVDDGARLLGGQVEPEGQRRLGGVRRDGDVLVQVVLVHRAVAVERHEAAARARRAAGEVDVAAGIRLPALAIVLEARIPQELREGAAHGEAGVRRLGVVARLVVDHHPDVVRAVLERGAIERHREGQRGVRRMEGPVDVELHPRHAHVVGGVRMELEGGVGARDAHRGLGGLQVVIGDGRGAHVDGGEGVLHRAVLGGLRCRRGPPLTAARPCGPRCSWPRGTGRR